MGDYMFELSKMTKEELYYYISKMSEEELYKYIRSKNTNIKLLQAIADAVTFYADFAFVLSSVINLPRVDILLSDENLSTKFLECLEDVLISKYADYGEEDEVMFLNPLVKIFEHQNTTQKMLRHACNCGFHAYAIDKFNVDEPENRKILKKIRKEDPNLEIRKKASKILKKDSNSKTKAVTVLVNLNSLMQEFFSCNDSDFKSLYDYETTGNILQKLSLLLEEMSKFREQTNAEKLIFVPVFSKIYEYNRGEERISLNYGHDSKYSERHHDIYLFRDYVPFEEQLDFCEWFCSCIAKIVNDGYINKDGNTVIPENIIFDTIFYFDGYIRVERTEESDKFNIRRYVKRDSMKDGIVNYFDELAEDYRLLQAVDIDIIRSSNGLDFIERLYGKHIPVSVMCSSGYSQISAPDGTFSDDDGFVIERTKKEYNEVIKFFQYLNATQKEYNEAQKQESAKHESTNSLTKKKELFVQLTFLPHD